MAAVSWLVLALLSEAIAPQPDSGRASEQRDAQATSSERYLRPYARSCCHGRAADKPLAG